MLHRFMLGQNDNKWAFMEKWFEIENKKNIMLFLYQSLKCKSFLPKQRKIVWITLNFIADHLNK